MPIKNDNKTLPTDQKPGTQILSQPPNIKKRSHNPSPNSDEDTKPAAVPAAVGGIKRLKRDSSIRPDTPTKLGLIFDEAKKHTAVIFSLTKDKRVWYANIVDQVLL